MSYSTTERLASSILSDYIENGQLKAGDKLPSLRELAAKYGTSANSVAHAIGALSLQGVVDKRHGSGCFVSIQAPAVRINSAQLIGLIIQAQNYEVMMRVYAGVQKAVRMENFQLVVGDAQWNY